LPAFRIFCEQRFSNAAKSTQNNRMSIDFLLTKVDSAKVAIFDSLPVAKNL
jgi:hypothetical protein